MQQMFLKSETSIVLEIKFYVVLINYNDIKERYRGKYSILLGSKCYPSKYYVQIYKKNQ